MKRMIEKIFRLWCFSSIILFYYYSFIVFANVKLFCVIFIILFCYLIASSFYFYSSKPKLTPRALFILFITVLSLMCPIFSFSLLLSIVLICSVSTTESAFKPLSPVAISIWVGNLFFPVCEVMAAAMTVGLCLFPMSFCMMMTGLIPPCSEPTTGLKSA